MRLKDPTPQLDGEIPVLLRHRLRHRLGLRDTGHQRQADSVRPDQRNDTGFGGWRGFHQGLHCFCSHARAQDSVESRRCSSSLDVPEDCHPCVHRKLLVNHILHRVGSDCVAFSIDGSLRHDDYVQTLPGLPLLGKPRTQLLPPVGLWWRLRNEDELGLGDDASDQS